MQLADTQTETRAAAPLANWYAILTRHQHEKAVAFSLSNKNHEVFLPLYRSVRRWQDRAKSLWFPLFPCYLFVREGMDRQLQIVSTPGVVHVVKWGGQPAVVPRAQLDAVRRMVESSLPLETHQLLQSGDCVRVKTGPLAGLEGTLTRRKGIARLVVSIEMLGRAAAVEIDGTNVERISAREPFSRRFSTGG